MTNIGETLRAAREEQALSLDDVVAVTRIRAHFLEALEENNFDALGGQIYVRGFLRNYATFLGLDPDPLLAPFSSQEHKLPVYEPRAQPRYLAEPLQSNPLPIGRILFMLFVLILLGVIGFSVWVKPTPLDSILAFQPSEEVSPSPVATAIEPIVVEKSDSSEVVSEEPTEPAQAKTEAEVMPTEAASVIPTEPSEEAVAEESNVLALESTVAPSATLTIEASPTTVEEVATAVPTATLPPRRATPVLTNAVSTETPQPTAIPADEGVVIQAQILANTWLRVFVDNDSAGAVQKTAGPGESFEWIGQESVNIRAGNGAAISLTVNGEEYGLLGESNQVIDLRWERNLEGGPPVLIEQ